MRGIVRATLFIIAFISFVILSWLIVIPDELIRSRIEESFSNNKRLNLSINGIRKSPLFKIKANSLIIRMDKKEIISITEPSVTLPLYLFRKGFTLSIKGRIKDGEIYGELNPPDRLSLNIIKVGIDSISYIRDIGFKGDGHLSGTINLKDEVINIRFEIPDLKIISIGESFFPFANSFHHLQGAININGSNVDIDSIGLEGEKGYARITGNIKGNNMKLSLELMPHHDKLTPLELMLINKYQVSPGYYVVPISNLLPAS